MKLIVLIVVVFLVVKYIKKSTGKTTGYKSGRLTQNTGYGLHCTVGNGKGTYSSVLNNCQNVAQNVARHTRHEVKFLVMVRKLSSANCSIAFQIEDCNFSSYNITFGNEFSVNDDFATFETKYATGFTTPDDVKRELLLQFNWSDIPAQVTELSILDRGEFAVSPMVTFRCTANG